MTEWTGVVNLSAHRLSLVLSLAGSATGMSVIIVDVDFDIMKLSRGHIARPWSSMLPSCCPSDDEIGWLSGI